MKPTHIAYVVSTLTEAEKKAGEQPFWRTVGAVWPYSKGDGFDVVIYDQISVGGRITCRQRKDKPAEAGDATE